MYLVIFTYVYADNFSIEKTHEFGFAQSFISSGSLKMEYPFIYGMTSHGLEIYHIDENKELEKISMVPIRGPYYMKTKDNYVYISNFTLFGSNDGICKLYQINVSDKYNPFIADSLVFDNNLEIVGLEIFGNQLYFGLTTGVGLKDVQVYSIPDMEFVCHLPTDLYLYKVNDTLAINYYNLSGMSNIYDTSDFTDLQLIGEYDFGDRRCGYFSCLNDTTVLATSQYLVTIWDISDPANWSLLSEYVPQYILRDGNNFIIFDDYAFLINSGYLEIIDISDPCSIQPVDTASTYGSARAAAYYNNSIFVATRIEGIKRYNFENNILTYSDVFFEYTSFYTAYAYENYLFAHPYKGGMNLFDVSDPCSPQEKSTILNNSSYRSLRGYKNLVWVVDTSDYSHRIYDISDPENPILKSIIPVGDYYQVYWSYLRFDGDNLDEVYVFYLSPVKLQKYDIFGSGNAQLLFEYTDLDGYSFLVQDGLGYMTKEGNSYNELYIIDGLNDNDPYMAEYYPSFMSGNDDCFLQLCDGFLCTINKPTQFFSLADPYEPEFCFELEYPASSGRLRNFEHIIFADIGFESYIYNVNEYEETVISPIDLIEYYTYLQDMGFYTTSTMKYVFAIEESVIEVFEFSYDVSIEEHTEQEKSVMQSLPNPFTSSTTISFSEKMKQCGTVRMKTETKLEREYISIN